MSKRVTAFERAESQALHGTILEELGYHGTEYIPSFEIRSTVSEYFAGVNVVLDNFI